MEVDPSGTGLGYILSVVNLLVNTENYISVLPSSRHYQPSWPWRGGSHSQTVLNHILCCGQTIKNFGSFSLKWVSIHIKLIGQCSSAGLISWSTTVLYITPSYMYHPTRIPEVPGSSLAAALTCGIEDNQKHSSSINYTQAIIHSTVCVVACAAISTNLTLCPSPWCVVNLKPTMETLPCSWHLWSGPTILGGLGGLWL